MILSYGFQNYFNVYNIPLIERAMIYLPIGPTVGKKANSKLKKKKNTAVNNFGSIRFPSCRLFVGSKYVLLILFYRKRADTSLF